MGLARRGAGGDRTRAEQQSRTTTSKPYGASTCLRGRASQSRVPSPPDSEASAGRVGCDNLKAARPPKMRPPLPAVTTSLANTASLPACWLPCHLGRPCHLLVGADGHQAAAAGAMQLLLEAALQRLAEGAAVCEEKEQLVMVGIRQLSERVLKACVVTLSCGHLACGVFLVN